SEGIEVRSVFGRFLEHSRLFMFEAGERAAYYLGSADLMPRNLDHRIEVVVPVDDPRHRDELTATFASLMADNTGAWRLLPSGAWERVRPSKSDRGRSAQATLGLLARRRGSYRQLSRF